MRTGQAIDAFPRLPDRAATLMIGSPRKPLQPWQSADAPRTAGEAPTGSPMSRESQNAAGVSPGRDIPDDLRRALTGAAATGDYGGAGVHEAICGYVRELRGRGLPPEAVVIAVKAAVRGTTIGPSSRQLDRRRSGELLDRAVRWCIEEYYTESPHDRPPS